MRVEWLFSFDFGQKYDVIRKLVQKTNLENIITKRKYDFEHPIMVSIIIAVVFEDILINYTLQNLILNTCMTSVLNTNIYK